VRLFWRSLRERDQVETIESGVLLSGGGALIAPLVAALRQALGLDLRVGPRPDQAVLRGLALLAEGRGAQAWEARFRGFIASGSHGPSACSA
jgi:hypothetical protein